jgi:hypothetical protein
MQKKIVFVIMPKTNHPAPHTLQLTTQTTTSPPKQNRVTRTDLKFAVRDWTYRAIDAYSKKASQGGIAISPLKDLEEEQQKEVRACVLVFVQSIDWLRACVRGALGFGVGGVCVRGGWGGGRVDWLVMCVHSIEAHTHTSTNQHTQAVEVEVDAAEGLAAPVIEQEEQVEGKEAKGEEKKGNIRRAA